MLNIPFSTELFFKCSGADVHVMVCVFISCLQGEVITVIRRVDENWAEGKLGDRIGIFPLAFVELNSVARALMKLSTK
jgi:hypothetical protein